MEIIYKQNGGSEIQYAYDCENEDEIRENTPVVPVSNRTRSFVLGYVDPVMYEIIKENIDKLKQGDGTHGSGGLVVRVFKPNQSIAFNNELITIDDYRYPNRTECFSSLFVDDIIENNKLDTNRYRIAATDLIWCRSDVLFDRLNEL